MKFKKHLLAVLLASMLMAAMSCQSARPAPLLPPKQANVPAVTNRVSTNPVSDDKSRQSEVAPPVPKSDPAESLITSVEKEFQSGQDSATAGNAEEARQHFDQALDLLNSTSLDIHSDPRLAQEF